jgi:hypothetical protein
MATRKLDKAQWHAYFDAVTRGIVGMRAEIEVDALNVGSQIEAEWLPLFGIVYDHKGDALEVALEGVDHIIRSPREVYIDEGVTGLTSMLVVDADGTREIVRLREPLMLPAPVS